MDVKENQKGCTNMRIFNDTPFRLDTRTGPFASFSFANEEERLAALDAADKALDFELTMLPATLYMNYARTGNRTLFETPYHARRRALHALLLGCLAGGGDRYTDKMIDLIWAISEETTWVIPPHSITKPYELVGEPLPDCFADDIIEVDLFAAETAALLSWVYHFEKERLDAVTPVICKRIEYEIERRILTPYQKIEMRWMTNFINNWTPWIISNVLVAAGIFLEKAPRRLRAVITLSMVWLDRFIATYGDDGGCNEGPSYWTAAVAALFDAVLVLKDITGGTLDVTVHPMLRRMCEYCPDVCIAPEKKLYANFADGPRHVSNDRRLFIRMAKYTGSEKLLHFAGSLTTEPHPMPSNFQIYRELLSLGEPVPERRNVPFADGNAIYPDLQLAVLRRGGFFLAVKGGHNRESHNHNDIGSVILYHGATPVLVDAGVGVYTKDTFSDKRYTIWTMQSSYHNLPEIDGMMQLPGRAFHADSFGAEDDTVTVSYRSAYPKELNAADVKRMITATEDEIVIRDEVTDAKNVIYHYLLADKPTPAVGGFAVGGCTIAFGKDYTVEPIDISGDNSLRSDWKREKLYRVSIPTDGTLTTVIRKEKE